MSPINHQDEKTRSHPHRRVEHILDSLRIAYMSEYNVGRFHLDIWLPESWAGIEIDGSTHSPRKNQHRDDELWNKFRLPILHLPIGLPIIEIKERIIKFIEIETPTASDRKRECLTN